MKKIYMNPETVVVNLKVKRHFLMGSYDLGSVNDADNATKNGGWNARQSRYWDDEDEDY